MGEVKVKKGVKESVGTLTESDYKKLTGKQNTDKIERNVVIEEEIKAPVKKGQQVGKIELMENGKKIGEVKIVAEGDVIRIGTVDVLLGIIKQWLLK